MFKWIAALIGYSFFRFPGAILGFFVGAFVDGLNQGTVRVFSGSTFAIKPAEFELNLLALAAMVIKSDGQVKSQELQFVRSYFIAQYGQIRASEIFKIFNDEIKKELQNTSSLALFFNQNTHYETRLQILHFLFGVANSDGSITIAELQKILSIASELGLYHSDVESIKAMFIKSEDTAYKILEISPPVSDEEVKRAYRTMAKKYHPDKLQSKDPAMIKGAKEKFQEVQKAYESIMKARKNQ